MTKQQMNEYAMRISQTNRTGLVVVLYEIIDNYIASAMEALKKEDLSSFTHNIKKSRQFLNQLQSGLDFHYGISYELMNLYMYVNDCLVQSEVKRQNVQLEQVRDIMGRLGAAFEQVAKEDSTGPVMRNSQRVYEGLTYGKNGRNNVNITGRMYE